MRPDALTCSQLLAWITGATFHSHVKERAAGLSRNDSLQRAEHTTNPCSDGQADSSFLVTNACNPLPSCLPSNRNFNLPAPWMSSAASENKIFRAGLPVFSLTALISNNFWARKEESNQFWTEAGFLVREYYRILFQLKQHPDSGHGIGWIRTDARYDEWMAKFIPYARILIFRLSEDPLRHSGSRQAPRPVSKLSAFLSHIALEEEKRKSAHFLERCSGQERGVGCALHGRGG
jgi:hypothetical protein